MNFAALLKSEFRKIIYARSTWWLLFGAVAFASLSTAVVPFVLANTGTTDANGAMISSNPLLEPSVADAVFGKAAASYYFSMILGAMIMAGEFAKGTAIATFLSAPKRLTVLLVKIVVASLVGLGVQLVSAAFATGAGLAALSAYPHASPHASVFADLALTAAISGIVMGLVGLSVGALMRNQTAAIISLLGWMFLIDPILTVVLAALKNEGGKYLFTALIAGMMDLHIDNKVTQNPLASTMFLPPLTSMLILIGYATVLVVASTATSMRRDID